MNDVNLNSPDLKLVRTSEQAPARASASPRNEGAQANASAQAAPSASRLSSTDVQQPSRVERLQENREVQREQLNDAVTRLNDFVQTVQRDLQFEVNNDSGKTIVRVVDQATDKVIRQIPDDVALRLAENLQQDEPLTLFNIEV
ncbi:flagellar protein FlaG [Marinobacter caseinilyticus]|uniref:flagellar protein FlaG n=1 Tax=Marinobacter caseinilyticus TaxID=2692195 RepID=UPI0014078A08|nr:flagellar protein FlaG [Marinobacter caseinilyticus]